MAIILNFPPPEHVDTEPHDIIASAVRADLAVVVVVGITRDAREFFASSRADGADALWLLERAKHNLMTIADDTE